MTGEHETFLLLAARDLNEGLTSEESPMLDAHLAACPSCRRAAAGMRRDESTLRAMLTEAPVAPRVRAAVMDAARGRRRTDGRLVLALAAALGLGLVGFAIVAGGLTPRPSIEPSPPPTAPAPAPSPSPTSSASAVPVAGGSVNGAYSYTVAPGATRRDTVAARLEGGPAGEWSRMVPATGEGTSLGGPVTCLVIDGPDAWLAGPATTSTDGSADRAAFLFVHDGGPGGVGDTAILWVTDPGQTLTTMEQWCESRFIPADPYPLDDGDVTVSAGPTEPSPSV